MTSQSLRANLGVRLGLGSNSRFGPGAPVLRYQSRRLKAIPTFRYLTFEPLIVAKGVFLTLLYMYTVYLEVGIRTKEGKIAHAILVAFAEHESY